MSPSDICRGLTNAMMMMMMIYQCYDDDDDLRIYCSYKFCKKGKEILEATKEKGAVHAIIFPTTVDGVIPVKLKSEHEGTDINKELTELKLTEHLSIQELRFVRLNCVVVAAEYPRGQRSRFLRFISYSFICPHLTTLYFFLVSSSFLCITHHALLLICSN